MSNVSEEQEGLVELADGRKVSVDDLKVGYMKGSDYTKKTQEHSRQREAFLEEKAKLAEDRARLNLINANPAARAAFDGLAANPQGVAPFMPQGQKPPEDAWGTPPPANPADQGRVEALAGMVEGMGKTVNDWSRTQAVNATSAELDTNWDAEHYPYIDKDLVLTEINGSQHLWHLPAKAQVQAVVMGHYGDKILADAQNAGYVKAQAEHDVEHEKELRLTTEAANTPTPLVIEGEVHAEPTPAEMIRLSTADPEKYRALSDAITNRRIVAEEARDRQRFNLMVNRP